MSEPGHGPARRLEGVLFDYGETLVHFERPDAALAVADQEIVALLAASGRRAPSATDLRSRILDRVERAVLDHQGGDDPAEMSVVTASRSAYAEAGLDVDDGLLDELLRIEQEAWWQGAHLDPAAVPVLDMLRAGGVRVGICSNAPYRVRSLHGQLAFLGLDTHLDAVTFSAEVGWRKPSSRIFAAALRALGTEASGTVMVGDSEVHDIAGAHAAGMRAVLLCKTRAHAHTAAESVIIALADLTDALRSMGLYWS
ncbi:MAG TPA: HAD-IA family hydrolase [Candidatus Dormibacteraeota bacterium]